MKTSIVLTAIAAATFTLKASAHGGADLHVNPKWEECSFQLDKSLTQEEFHQFAQEAGMVLYFRPLTDARPMGKGKFELSVLQWNTRIDETIGAWNNTFVHPDKEHWLIGGEELPFPGLTLRAGITSKIDAGVYWSERPGANYGVWGGQVQYSLVNDTSRQLAVAARANYSALYGPDDVDLEVGGIDFTASKTIRVHKNWLSVSPYAGVSGYVSHAHERSDVVSLKDEHRPGLQGMAGMVANISIVRLGVEYNLAAVNTFSYKVGVAMKLW